MELVFLLNPFIPYSVDRFTNLSFIIFAQIPLLGYSLYIIFLRKGSILGLGSAVLVLCLLWTLGFFTCFSSPYTGGISDAVSQNEVYRFQWLSRVNENHSYIMSFEEKEGSNALPEKFSGNLNRSAELTKISDMHIYTSKSDSDWVIPSKTLAKSKPFYLVVTTFSGALNSDEREHDGVPVFSGNDQRDDPVYKIYDA